LCHLTLKKYNLNEFLRAKAATAFSSS